MLDRGKSFLTAKIAKSYPKLAKKFSAFLAHLRELCGKQI